MDNTSYAEALEQIKVELAQKRNDLAAHAKMTVADLEPQIPKLQAQINTLTSEISRLEGLVVTTSKQSEYDKDYWNKQYINLKDKIEKEHQSRMEVLNQRDVAQNNRDTAYQLSIAELHSREQSLIEDKEELISDQKEHSILIEKFEKDKESHEKLVGEIMDKVSKHLSDAKSEYDKHKEITDNLEKQSQTLAVAIQECNNSKSESNSKIEEYKRILESCNQKELENIKKQEELRYRESIANESHVRSKANIQRDFDRADELDKREKQLNERENNIKLAEALLSKG